MIMVIFFLTNRYRLLFWYFAKTQKFCIIYHDKQLKFSLNTNICIYLFFY